MENELNSIIWPEQSKCEEPDFQNEYTSYATYTYNIIPGTARPRHFWCAYTQRSQKVQFHIGPGIQLAFSE